MIPTQKDISLALLLELVRLGGPIRHEQTYTRVETHFPYLTSDDKAAMLQDGRTPVWTNKIEWARNYLREQGTLAPTDPGVWQANAQANVVLRGWLLERSLSDPDSFITSRQTLPDALGAGWARESRRRQRTVSRARSRAAVAPPALEQPTPVAPTAPTTLAQLLQLEEESMRGQLMERLQDIPWDAFERLVGRLLASLGFSDVRVVGRPGDEGVDLIANFGNDLLQASVAVQVKRRRDNIAAPDVSYLRDRWSSRAGKLLFITTSDYRPGARDVAEDPSHKTVKLICGSELVEVMLKHGVGVKATSVVPLTIDQDFFESV